jgi:hypothetical protein
MNAQNSSLVLGYVAFLGMGVEQKGYQCFDPVSHRLRISRHVVFWEHKLFHEVGKFSMPSFPPFTALLEMPLFHPTTGDVFPESSLLELQSSTVHDVASLESPYSIQSEAPAHTSHLLFADPLE